MLDSGNKPNHQNGMQNGHSSEDKEISEPVPEKAAAPPLTNGDHSGSTNKPAPSLAAQKVAAQSQDVDKSLLCKVCGKKVYETEKISVNGAIYHKSCFRCKQCNR